MRMPNTKYTGSFIKKEAQGSSGPVSLSNSASKKYYGKMIDAPGFKKGGSPAWTRKEGKSESGGLNQKGVDSYKKANPGSKLKTAVTTKPSKLKKGSKAAKRRKSFCARMTGMRKRQKASNNTGDDRLSKSLRKWNC